MDEMYFYLIAIGIICFSIVVLVLGGFAMYFMHDTKVKREQNDRIERIEAGKRQTEIEKAKVESLDIRREMMNTQLEYGVLNGDNQREEEGGLGGLINMVLQNPQLLQSILGKTAGNTQGGDNGANAPSFPASTEPPTI